MTYEKKKKTTENITVTYWSDSQFIYIRRWDASQGLSSYVMTKDLQEL